MSVTIIHEGGENRILSLKPRTMPVGDRRCCAGVMGVDDAPPLIARKDWLKCVDLSHAVLEILDQDGYSLCHSFGGTQANEMAHVLLGRDQVQLSAGNLAGQVTGYRDAGAGVDEVLAVITSVGQVARSVIGQNDYRGRDWPSDWKTKAKLYKVNAYDCGHEDVTDGMASGLLRGNVSLLGTNAFGGGHAVVGCGYWIDANDVVRFFGPNSWAESYNGFTSALLDSLSKNHPNPELSRVLRTKGAGFWVYQERQLTAINSYGAFVVDGVQALDTDNVPPLA